MSEILSQLLTMFVAFFLAHVAAKYVESMIHPFLDRRAAAHRADQHLAEALSEVIDPFSLTETLGQISQGTVQYRRWQPLHNVVELSNAGRTFHNKRLRNEWKVAEDAIRQLLAFTDREFSSDDYDLLKIHKYRDVPNGHDLYERNLTQLGRLLGDASKTCESVYQRIRARFPDVGALPPDWNRVVTREELNIPARQGG